MYPITSPAPQCLGAGTVCYPPSCGPQVPNNLVSIFYGGSGTPNMLGLILFAIAFGIAIVVCRRATNLDQDHGDLLLPLISQTLDATLLLVLMIVKTTPVAVASLLLVCGAGVGVRDVDGDTWRMSLGDP